MLGRGDQADFVLYAGEGIQPAHAHIILRPNGYWIQPAQRIAAVYVNQQLIPHEQHLRHENEITLGSLVLRFTEQPRRCPACDAENPVRSQFCRKCGKPLASP